MSATRCAIEWSIRKEARGMPGRKRSAQRAPASDLIQLDVEKVHWHLRRATAYATPEKRFRIKRWTDFTTQVPPFLPTRVIAVR
jgi:hypothetical protein